MAAGALRASFGTVGSGVLAAGFGFGHRRGNGAVSCWRPPRLPRLENGESPFSIGELFEVCRLAALYLGNDTGTMHVAAAVDCPAAAVISARNPPGAWDPDLPASARLVFRHRTFCENCFLNACEVEGFRCMLSITVEDVVAELLPFVRKILSPPA